MSEPLPEFVRYNGFVWRIVPKDEQQVTLSIIGFANSHTLTWGRKAVAKALRDGTMQDDSTTVK